MKSLSSAALDSLGGLHQVEVSLSQPGSQSLDLRTASCKMLCLLSETDTKHKRNVSKHD